MLKPVLLVTCRAGNEAWCIEEIGNALFEHDPEVVVERTKYPGLLIVFSNLDVEKAYNYALWREYGFVEHIIPINRAAQSLDEVERAVMEIVSDGERVKVKVRVRGSRGLSKTLWSLVMKALRSKNAAHNPSSSTCLYVEGVEDKIYIGKARC